MYKATITGVIATVFLLSAAFAGFADAPDGPHVVTQDDKTIEFDAIDPGSRTADMFAIYTPEFGETTETNEFGGEVVAEPTGVDGEYEVAQACDFFQYDEGECERPGDNEIPENGYVISGSPDEGREIIGERFDTGDTIQIEIPELQEATTSLDVIDPTADNNPEGVEEETDECFPGCRGAEQLVMYTTDSGETTGTNEFGDELLVVEDRVVQRGGFDTPIPEDGFVLSGHGGQGEWLISNSIVGASVEIDESDMEVTITVDEEAYLAAAEGAIDRAENALENISGNGSERVSTVEDLVNDAVAELEAASEASEGGANTSLTAAAERAVDYADEAWIYTRESRSPEGRAAWVRPEDDWDSREKIEEQVSSLAEAGVNILYLETFFQGYTIYDSDIAADAGIESQRPSFAEADIDALSAWHDAAQEYGLETHAWVHTFFVGNPLVSDGDGPVLEVQEDWAAIPRETALDESIDDFGAPAENGYRFMDPAHEEVQEYLLSLFEEMLVDYELDGLHLDYIRYPISRPAESGFSYGASADGFEDEYGVDPLEIDEADSEWEDWIEYRESVITRFVERVSNEVDSIAPDSTLSAAIFPDLEGDAAQQKFQRWDVWAERALVDVLAGMSFGTAPRANAEDTRTLLEYAGDTDVEVYIGNYSPLNGSDPVVMIQQIEAIRDAGANGIGLFSYSQITDSQLEALEKGVFREQTTPR